ncbi:MAG: hypothetical protein WCV86_04240 [Patescibacteria group bacterium]|jgi:hypothetical protein
MKLSLRLNAVTSFLNKQFRWAMLGIVAVLLIFGFMVLIIPKWQELSKLGLITLEREREQTVQAEEYLGNLRRSLDEFRLISDTKIAQLEQVLPTEFDVAPLFLEMESLFNAAGYALNSIDILDQGAQKASTAAVQQSNTGQSAVVRELITRAQKNAEVVSRNEKLRVIQISLSLTGAQDYKGIKKLLTTIEQHQRLMDIRSVGISVGGKDITEETATAEGQISFTVNIYYFAE